MLEESGNTMSLNTSLSAEGDGFPKPGDFLLKDGVRVEVFARAQLPTRFGDFEVFIFKNNLDVKEHLAVVTRGGVGGDGDLPVRVHSECLTGDVLGSLRCDCRDQLEIALRMLGREPKAMLIYMRQEGRGIGLGNKIRAYALQQEGLDTVQANEHLGFDDDLRDYRVSALMIQLFGPRSIHLATNNPSKISGLREFGVNITARIPVLTDVNPHNTDYLCTKARKSGHILPF